MVEHKQKKQVGFVFDLVLLSVPGRSYKYHGEDCEESAKSFIQVHGKFREKVLVQNDK